MSQGITPGSVFPEGKASTLNAGRNISRITTASRAVAGAFLGLAWAASLRAWMVLLALQFGERPQFSWKGTFGGILLPAALMGAIFGGASGPAATSGRKRWAILSPLLLVLGPALVTDHFISTLITTGIGGGAIAVALIGMLGGYAFSGYGVAWLRRAVGVLVVFFTLASGIALSVSERENAAVSNASRVFSGLLFVLLMALFIAGVSAPFRRRSK